MLRGKSFGDIPRAFKRRIQYNNNNNNNNIFIRTQVQQQLTVSDRK